MPALLIRMSMRPNSAFARSTMARRSAREVTSVATASDLRPRAPTSSAVRLAPAWSISAMTISAPWCASSSAMARPMPRPAPVTIAACPLSSMDFLLARAGRQLVEGQVAVHADILRQAQHALRDDIAQDLVGAGGDAPARRGEQRFLEGG